MPDEPPVTSAAFGIWVVYQEGNTAWRPNTSSEGAPWVLSSPQEGGGFGRRLRTSYDLLVNAHRIDRRRPRREVLGGTSRRALRASCLSSPRISVGLPADDAAVYKLDDDRALVFTLDFFPPLVDDPATFGRIAATNALNDVFAMGGSPLLALSIAAFPEELPTEVLGAVFAAAAEQVRTAGAILAGGHTIRDAEPKYGLAVVGTVHPDGIWPKSGARPGDALS
jgi:hypothetical protein